MGDLLWALAAIAGLVGLLFFSTRFEPHWVARDGRRMIATAQLLDGRGMPRGRPFDARVAVLPDDALLVRRRGLRGRRESVWLVRGQSPDPPRRRAIFLLRPADDTTADELLTLRMPARSRAVPVLEGLASGGRTTR